MWHPNSWVVSFTLNPHCIRENVQSAAWRCDLMVQVLQVFTALDTSRGVGSRWGGKERRLGVGHRNPHEASRLGRVWPSCLELEIPRG